jgi:hypothetical protein
MSPITAHKELTAERLAHRGRSFVPPAEDKNRGVVLRRGLFSGEKHSNHRDHRDHREKHTKRGRAVAFLGGFGALGGFEARGSPRLGNCFVTKIEFAEEPKRHVSVSQIGGRKGARILRHENPNLGGSLAQEIIAVDSRGRLSENAISCQ